MNIVDRYVQEIAVIQNGIAQLFGAAVPSAAVIGTV